MQPMQVVTEVAALATAQTPGAELADGALDEALERREMQVERTINLWRAAGLGVFSFFDLVGLVHERGPYSRVTLVLCASLVVFAGYSFVVHRLASDGRYRSWLKYLTIEADFVFVTALFLFYEHEGVAAMFGLDPNAFRIAFIGSLPLLVFMSALRSSARAIGYATLVGLAAAVAIGARPGISPVLPFEGCLTIALAGALGWAVSAGVTRMFVRLRQRERLTRFLSREVVDRVDKGELALEPGGALKTVTVMFSDIRGFTGLSERLDPRELVGLLNEYFARMTAIVFAHGGTVDKFIGDAVMAVFGAPAEHPDDASRAVVAAREMGVALGELNAKWAAEGRPTLAIGIGLHTGSAVAGIIGSPERLEYTVVGDTVNVASRIEGLNKTHGTWLLMSEATKAAIDPALRTRFVADAEVRGRTQHVGLYTLDGAAA